jgi:hypothetical protein
MQLFLSSDRIGPKPTTMNPDGPEKHVLDCNSPHMGAESRAPGLVSAFFQLLGTILCGIGLGILLFGHGVDREIERDVVMILFGSILGPIGMWIKRPT